MFKVQQPPQVLCTKCSVPLSTAFVVRRTFVALCLFVAAFIACAHLSCTVRSLYILSG